MKKWWFSIVLGICYVSIFHAWIYCTTPLQVKITGISLASLLGITTLFIYKSYFYGGMDYFVHLSIILDILLESIFIFPHENYWFYGCFVGFAVVLVAFRRYKAPERNNHPCVVGHVN